MSEVLFEQGVSLNALDEMERNMRELEKRDFTRTWGSVREGLIASIHYSDSVVTATLDGSLMALFGVSQHGEGIYCPWLVLTDAALNHRAKLVRFMRAWVTMYLEKYGHLRNWVPVEDVTAVDLLEVVGFKVDRGQEHFRAGEPYYIFEASLEDL